MVFSEPKHQTSCNSVYSESICSSSGTETDQDSNYIDKHSSGSSLSSEKILQTRTNNIKYVVAAALIRKAFKVFLAIFLLFYGAAVVNFLFQGEQREISKNLRFFSTSELEKYAILKDSALEDVFNAIGMLL